MQTPCRLVLSLLVVTSLKLALEAKDFKIGDAAAWSLDLTKPADQANIESSTSVAAVPGGYRQTADVSGAPELRQ